MSDPETKPYTDTIFAQIIRHEVPAHIEYEDDHFIAFDDLYPVAPVHILIVPKKSFATLLDVPMDDDETFAGLLKTARKVAEKMDLGGNYRLVMNVGQVMQEIHHIHLHLIGGWSEETMSIIRQRII